MIFYWIARKGRSYWISNLDEPLAKENVRRRFLVRVSTNFFEKKKKKLNICLLGLQFILQIETISTVVELFLNDVDVNILNPQILKSRYS